MDTFEFERLFRREAVISLSTIENFNPHHHFTIGSKVVDIVHVDDYFRELVDCSGKDKFNLRVKPSLMQITTIRRPITGPDAVEFLRLQEDLIRYEHIWELLKKQPRGERNLADSMPGPLLAKRRFGNMFVTGIINGVPRATRLRYYDRLRANVGTDEMGYSRSGWVIDVVSTDSPDFSQQGGRIGYYIR